MFEGDSLMAGLISLGDSVIKGTVPIKTTRDIKDVSISFSDINYLYISVTAVSPYPSIFLASISIV